VKNELFPSSNLALIVIDLQERLINAMRPDEIASVISKCEILVNASLKLNIPVIFTEQYPKGLGPTVENLKKYFTEPPIEKTTFSCFGSAKFAKKLEEMNIKSLIICGIETHVCVQQTSFDALERGMNIFVPADATCSRDSQNKSISLNLMLYKGITVTSVESLLFAILRDSMHPSFKEISRILK